MKRFPSILVCIVLFGCTSDVIEPPVPNTSKPTTTLEAEYTTTLPNKISASYWKTADYLSLNPINEVSGQVIAGDGLYNMSGTYNGLASFNKGNDPNIIMKAAYTNDSIYLLISWMDTLYHASQRNWLYDGPSDPNKPGSTTGWTSQRSDDNFQLSLDMSGGKLDIWNWSLALSEPLGFAVDMIDTGGGPIADSGDKIYVRNAVGDDRSGPLYAWDGTEQKITRKPGGVTILDPGFFLLNKTTFTGNLINGSAIFQAECALCHGTNGDGETGAFNPSFKRLNVPGQFNRWTRTALDAYASDPGQHEGATHYPTIEIDRQDIFARLRGFSGVPGYFLQNPSGSSSDVRAVSNVKIANIDTYNSGYSVLIIRALNTAQVDDIVLDPTLNTYAFNFSLRDNDAINRIGSVNQILTFKPKAQ